MKKRRIVGYKLFIGPGLCDASEKEYKKFLSDIEVDIQLTNASKEEKYMFKQSMCKYYDDDTGEIHFIFKEPYEAGGLPTRVFEEDELLYEIDK